MTLYARQQKRDADIKNRLLDSVGEGENGMDLREWHWNMYIIICEMIASPGSMHETGHSGLVHWDDSERWDGEGGGRGLQDGGHMYTHGWLVSMYGKNHYNIVK